MWYFAAHHVALSYTMHSFPILACLVEMPAPTLNTPNKVKGRTEQELNGISDSEMALSPSKEL